MSPGIRDKILINFGFFKIMMALILGRAEAIWALLKMAKKQAKEIEQNGWLDDATDVGFLKRKEVSCEALEACGDDFLAGLDEYIHETKALVEDQRQWIDQKRAAQKP